MTSDVFYGKKAVNQNYLITGPGAMCIKFGSGLYSSVQGADDAAVFRAINMAKSLPGISLYKGIEGGRILMDTYSFQQKRGKKPNKETIQHNIERIFGHKDVVKLDHYWY